MTYTVVVAGQAAQEIEDATLWWARERSKRQADRWYAGIRRAIASLARNPQRYGLSVEAGSSSRELRELHFGLSSRPTHRIVFTILTEAVVVLAVRHVSQDHVRVEDLDD